MSILTFISVFLFGTIDETVDAFGVIEPETSVKVRSRTNGIVERVLVEEGREVKIGDTLLILNNEDLRLQAERLRHDLEKAETDLAQLQREYKMLIESGSFETAVVQENILQAQRRAEIAKEKYERAETLYQKNLISLEERNDTKLNYELLQSAYESTKKRLNIQIGRYAKAIADKEKEIELTEEALRLAKEQMQSTTIMASISGIILTSEPKELKGKRITEGDEILEIADLTKLSLKAEVSERDMPKVAVGQDARVFITAFPHRKYKVFKGAVINISSKPKLTKRGVTFETKITLKEPWVEIKTSSIITRLNIKPGLTGRAQIVIRPKTRLIEEIFRKMITKE